MERQEADDSAAAAALFAQMVTLGERVFGATDPDFLDLLEAQTEYLVTPAAARGGAGGRPVLCGPAPVAGADDPKTVQALIYLSTAHGASGNYPKAEPLVVEAAARAERVLGPDHPSAMLALAGGGPAVLRPGHRLPSVPKPLRAGGAGAPGKESRLCGGGGHGSRRCRDGGPVAAGTCLLRRGTQSARVALAGG